MNFVTYREITRINKLLVLLCIVILTAVFYRLYYDYSKISCFKKGEMYYKSGRLVTAEDWYTKAESYKYFNYKESILSGRLSELKNITDYKRYIRDLAQEAKSASKANDTEALVKIFNEYKKKYNDLEEQGILKASIADEIQRKYSFEENLKDYFDEAEIYLKSLAENNLDKGRFQDESFKNVFLVIPEQYFGGKDKKKQETESFFKDYDNKKIDLISTSANLDTLLDEINKDIAFNKKNSFDTGWLIEKAEKLGCNIMNSDIGSNNYSQLAEHYKTYSVFIKQYMSNLQDSQVIALVNDKINDDYNSALKMVKSGKFRDAITLFTNIGSFRDTKHDIIIARLKWIQNEPDIVFNEVYPDTVMEGAISVSNAWGSPVNVLSYDESGKVYLIKADEECNYTKIEGPSPNYNAQIKSMKILNGINFNGPVILVEGTSNVRKAHYRGYAIINDGLKEIFNFQADGITVISSTKLLVDNPDGEGSGQQCYYTRIGNTFKFTGIKPDYTDITLDQLQNYKGEKVRFTCEIVGKEMATEKLLGESNGQYVLLSGGIRDFQTQGMITVVGKYTNDVNVNIDTAEKTIPEFNVMEYKNLQQ